MKNDHNSQRGKVLVVDDEPAIRMALAASFRNEGWRVETAADCAEARSRFQADAAPIVVTDVRLPDGDGISLMREFRSQAPATGIVLLTAHGSVPQAVEAIRNGACDYLLKPASFTQIMRAVEQLTQRLANTVACKSGTACHIVGNSPELIRAITIARQAAATGADVLIEAESGTGKELFARLIHDESNRRHNPFVAVNCAAVPDSLLENELFGHVKGAFTGAESHRAGRFESAQHGTLLLDEIGELPLTLQPKLLRILQERQLERLGDCRPIPIDVRVIATTNRSLAELVREGTFRLDLFYRLNVIPLTIPPLRTRGEDVILLAQHFLAGYSAGRGLRMTADFMTALRKHTWPGNVRELSNVMRRAVALCTNDEIGPEHFVIPLESECQDGRIAPGLSMKEAERKLLEATLVATCGNRTRTAEALGISLRTVRNKIREYGLPARRFA
jgi:DNA-binding NtrC family response regulator